MPRHSIVERSRIAFSRRIFLETAPVEAANSASSWRSSNAGGPARPYASWDRGQSGTRPYLYGRTCAASTHLWLRQTPQSPRLRRQMQRTQAAESHTHPPPLAAQGGIGGGHRAGGRAGSVAGAVSCRWRRQSGRRLLPHRWVWEGLRRALRWPLPRWAQQRHWPQWEQLPLRPRRPRQLWSARQRPRPQGWIAQLRQKEQVGEEPGCHGW